jgi:flagellar biosynthesis/type III secretory pathway chaperone
MMRINEQTLNIITGRSEKVTTYQSGGQLKSTAAFNPNTLATA